MAKIAIMKFSASDTGTTLVEKNLKDHCVDHEGNPIDMRLTAATAGYEIQERGISTIVQPFRVSPYKDQVTDADNGVYWTSDPTGLGGSSNNSNIKGKHKVVEKDISTDITSGYDKLNLYIAATGAAARVLEIKIWEGYA